MVISLGSTTLCSDATRASDGSPMGPANLAIAENPGAVVREYIGADRVAGEDTRCKHGSISFQATRVYATPSAAAQYALVGILSEAVKGALKVDSTTIYANAVVTSRRVGVSGCTVVIAYTIEG